MARTRRAETQAPDAAQETRDEQGVSRDTQEAEGAPAASEDRQEGAATQEMIGPDNPEDLLGCQEDAEEQYTDGLPPDAPLEYAVAGCDALNLRKEPSLDAPVIARLPRGVGVSETGSVQGEWMEVFTGQLMGWVMARYLEPVWS